MNKMDKLSFKLSEAILKEAKDIAQRTDTIEEFINIMEFDIEERTQALAIARSILSETPQITDAHIDDFNRLHDKYKGYYLFAISNVNLWISRTMLTEVSDWHQHIYDDLECSPEIDLEKITDLFYYRNWHFYLEPETGLFNILIDRSFYQATTIAEMQKLIDQGIADQ